MTLTEENPTSINNPSAAALRRRHKFRRPVTMGSDTAGDGHSSTTSSSSALTRQQPRQKTPPKRFVKSQIPDSILHNETLNAAVSLLPKNYNFEIHKLLHRVATLNARHVTLQFPDGLLLFSLPISDILLAFAPSVTDVSVLSDTSFGACCLDDLSAKSLGSDLLVHFGHSCLVPISCSVVPTHYVFVEITIDTNLLIKTLNLNFVGSGVGEIILAGTIQFAGGIREAKGRLEELGFRVVVPQARPLSKGEVLGCTAPRVPLDCGHGCGSDGGPGRETVGVFVADGRFHMEAFMIANPGLKRVFRYDPYMGKLILEEYDQRGMRESRKKAIEKAKEVFGEKGSKGCWGIVFGTLGRQGNPRILERLEKMMKERGYEYFVVLISEISPSKIALFEDSMDAWIQIACPRLSIDWGESFHKPLLTPFEAEIALGYIPGWWERGVQTNRYRHKMDDPEFAKESCTNCSCRSNFNNVKDGEIGDYPMDYYAEDGGDWNSCYVKKSASAKLNRRNSASTDAVTVGGNA